MSHSSSLWNRVSLAALAALTVSTCSGSADAAGTGRARPALIAEQLELELEQAIAGGREGHAQRVLLSNMRASRAETRPEIRAERIRLYALAWSLWGTPEFLAVARDLAADVSCGQLDQGQRAQMVRAMATLGQLSGDAEALAWARTEAQSLSDAPANGVARAVELGQAMLALYRATGRAEWLSLANAQLHTLHTRFEQGSGYASEAAPVLTDNLGVARFALALGRLDRGSEARAVAEHALRLVGDAVELVERERASESLDELLLGGTEAPTVLTQR